MYEPASRLCNHNVKKTEETRKKKNLFHFDDWQQTTTYNYAEMYAQTLKEGIRKISW